MVKLTWHDGNVPEELEVRQVYGMIFTEDGRVLLRIENQNGKKKFSLAGGTPEVFDDGVEATLRRELIEEVNTTIKKEVYVVGWQEVDEGNGKPPYAQLRMCAMIEGIGERKPDPDTNRTYERVLVSPERAIKLLNWKDVGEKLIHRAVEIAKEKFGLSTFEEKEEFV